MITLITYAIVLFRAPAVALFYILLWLSLAGWFFGFCCFWLDRYRVPVFTITAIWAIVTSSLLPGNSHYYPIHQSGAPAYVNPKALFIGRPLGRVVVVSAEGGGIHAEAWTATVLTRIAEALPQYPFLRSIRLLSGTSGGSVSHMFFETLYDNPNRLTDKECWEAVRTATRDGLGLRRVARGIVYHDLRRPFIPLPWTFSFSLNDRGSEIEQAWKEVLQTMDGKRQCSVIPDSMTMDSMRSGVVSGTRPLLLFNSTFGDDGRPLLITNFDLDPQFDKFAQGFTIFRKYYASDLPVVTAARLSASFPYVLPSPRPLACPPGSWLCDDDLDQKQSTDNHEKKNLAVIDGGLYDNTAVFGAYETLRQATNSFKEFSARVLWLQIRDSPIDDGSHANHGIATSAVGPLWTLYQVRGTGQLKRAEELTYSAETQSHSCLEHLVVPFPDRDTPLSWALAEDQKQKIDHDWYSQENRITKRVQDFFSTNNDCEFALGHE